jgi:hypothetical protein
VRIQNAQAQNNANHTQYSISQFEEEKCYFQSIVGLIAKLGLVLKLWIIQIHVQSCVELLLLDYYSQQLSS